MPAYPWSWMGAYYSFLGILPSCGNNKLDSDGIVRSSRDSVEKAFRIVVQTWTLCV